MHKGSQVWLLSSEVFSHVQASSQDLLFQLYLQSLAHPDYLSRQWLRLCMLLFWLLHSHGWKSCIEFLLSHPSDKDWGCFVDEVLLNPNIPQLMSLATGSSILRILPPYSLHSLTLLARVASLVFILRWVVFARLHSASWRFRWPISVYRHRWMYIVSWLPQATSYLLLTSLKTRMVWCHPDIALRTWIVLPNLPSYINFQSLIKS